MHDENVHALQVYLHQILKDPSVDLERRGSQPSHRLQKFKSFLRPKSYVDEFSHNDPRCNARTRSELLCHSVVGR